MPSPNTVLILPVAILSGARQPYHRVDIHHENREIGNEVLVIVGLVPGRLSAIRPVCGGAAVEAHRASAPPTGGILSDPITGEPNTRH